MASWKKPYYRTRSPHSVLGTQYPPRRQKWMMGRWVDGGIKKKKHRSKK